MISSVSEQLYIFLATLYGGMVIGFIYDLYRIFRGIFRPKKLATLIEDLIFWIVIGAAALVVLLFSNDGQLRFYTFLGFAMGALIYISVLSPYVLRCIILILKIIKKILSKLLHILLFPLRKLILLIKRPCRWILKKLQPIYLKVRRLKQLPRRWAKEMKKYAKLILKKK